MSRVELLGKSNNLEGDLPDKSTPLRHAQSQMDTSRSPGNRITHSVIHFCRGAYVIFIYVVNEQIQR